MEEKKKKRLKKEVIMTSLVLLELVIVYICIIVVKVNTGSQKETQGTYNNSNVHSSVPTPVSVAKDTILPSKSPKASVSPTKQPVASAVPTKKPVVASAPTTKPTATPEPTKKPAVSPTSTKKPAASSSKLSAEVKALYKDCVFIGDSRTEGLQLKTGLTSATFLTHRGLTVATAMTEKVIPLKSGKKGTILDALKEGTYKKVFIMFGVNELGWPYTTTFTKKYEKLINKIKKIQPDAEIYVQSIIPVTKEKSDSSKIYTIKHVKKFNKAIKAMTNDMKLHYLNVQEAVTKPNTYLPEKCATDGVHLTKAACLKWLDYITKEIS